jgi:hypothetical protein
MLNFLKKIFSPQSRDAGNAFGDKEIDAGAEDARPELLEEKQANSAYASDWLPGRSKAPHHDLVKKEFEYIGPTEDKKEWVKAGMFYPIWVSIAGIGHQNQNGSSRREAAKKCKIGNRLFLFWEKNNPFDSNAVAVFRKKGDNFGFIESNQIGYIERELAEECIKDFQSGKYRIGAEVMRVYVGQSGFVNIKIKMISFYES